MFAAWLAQVRCLSIELHDRYIPGCSETFKSAMAHAAFTQVEGEYGELEVWCKAGSIRGASDNSSGSQAVGPGSGQSPEYF